MITVSQTAEDGHIYKYRLGASEIAVEQWQNVRSWSLWDGHSEIAAETGQIITLVEATAEYKAVRSGTAVVIAK